MIWSLALSLTAAQFSTGFESLSAGAFQRSETRIGQLLVEQGQVSIESAHAKSGSHSLRFHGGSRNSALLKLVNKTDKAWKASFWAERWTSSAPFEFTISASTKEGWQKIYDGSDIAVGGFYTRAEFSIPAGVEMLRFNCVSPDNRGVMIDDWTMEAPQQMKVESVAVFQPTTPAMPGLDTNPILGIHIKTSGDLNPIQLNQLDYAFRGSNLTSDASELQVLASGDNPVLPGDSVPGFAGIKSLASSLPTTKATSFVSNYKLSSGDNYFWLSTKLKNGADQDGWIDAHVSRLRLNDTEIPTKNGDPEGRQRIATRLRTNGDSGAGAYRIPGLTSTDKGTLIGVYDIRMDGWRDLPGNVDVGMSRSTDGGHTWEPMKKIMDMGDDPKFSYDGIGDPAILFDPVTKTTWVIATWSHGERAWFGSQPGLEPEDTGQLMLVKSEDDGVTWSEPINITKQVKDPRWSYLLQGPGKGIALADGTIVFAAQYQLHPDEKRMPYSTLLYSKDHGKTWQINNGPKANTTEAQVARLSDGTLMLNMRDNRGGSRSVYTTSDLGETWTLHPTSRKSLVEPVCMASLISVDHELSRKNSGLLLFSNPNVNRAPRRHMTIKASKDDGMTWSSGLLIDEWQSAGYSCMTMIDKETVGILYEGSRSNLVFQRIPLFDLIAGF
jgi:sialidase-1